MARFTLRFFKDNGYSGQVVRAYSYKPMPSYNYCLRIVFYLTLHLRVQWRKKPNYECCLLGCRASPGALRGSEGWRPSRPEARRAEEVPRGGPAPQWTSILIVGFLQHRTRRCRVKYWTFSHEEKLLLQAMKRSYSSSITRVMVKAA